jgi:hypothetical protein
MGLKRNGIGRSELNRRAQDKDQWRAICEHYKQTSGSIKCRTE